MEGTLECGREAPLDNNEEGLFNQDALDTQEENEVDDKAEHL